LKSYIRNCIRICFCSLVLVSISFAQDFSPTVSQVREAFNNLNFKRTIELSARSISSYQNYPVEELVQIYLFRAMAFYNLGSEQESAESFRSALSLDPSLELDPVTVSPKIRSFFAEIRKSQDTRSVKAMSATEARYFIQKDIRPQAAWRSMVLPGWGQHYKGQEIKGYAIFSGFMLNTIGLITAVIYEKSSRDAYMNAVQISDIESRFREYEKWNNIRRVLTGTEIAIWLYAFGDALWSVSPKNPAISLRISPPVITASIQF